MIAFAPEELSVERLEELRSVTRVSGVALQGSDAKALAAVDPAVWLWLDARGWLISQNNSGEGWLGWLPIMRQVPTLRLLVAHCGLPLQAPPAERNYPVPQAVLQERLQHVLALVVSTEQEFLRQC